MPAPGEKGEIIIKLRIPTDSDDGSMIALCSLPQNGDDVVLDDFLGVFSSPRLAIISGMSAEMHLRMKVVQKFDAFLGQVMGALHFKKLKPVRDNFDDEAKMLYKRLNLPDPTLKRKPEEFSSYDVPDVVWVHPKTGAKFYIGNIGAAQNLDVL